MKHLRILILVLLMGGLASVTMGQAIFPLDFMRNNPKNVYVNPAFYTADFGYFDMALGNVTFNLQNIGLKYDKFFEFNAQGKPVVMDLNKGVESLRRNDYLNTFAGVDIFGCGRHTKHGFFTYSHRFREMETFHYNKEALEFLVKGNASFMGPENPAHVDFDVAVKAYQEFNFGYQMSLTEKLNVGARVKFLMGYADARSSAIKLQLMTDPATYALTVTGDVDVRVSLPYDVSMQHGDFSIADSRFNIANLFKNYGAGIDLGAEYQIDDQYGVAAAINDFGFIRWNNHSVRFKGGIENGGSLYHDGAFVFTGLTPDQVNAIIDEPSVFFEQLMDTLGTYYDLSTEPYNYFSGLNTTMMVRGYYDLTPEHRFSAQLTGYFSGIGLRPALTLAYTGSFGDVYDVVGTYTMMPGSYGNIGVGLSANWSGCLLYVATNNIFGLFNPANTSNVGIQFGLSLNGGQKVSREEKILLRDTTY